MIDSTADITPETRDLVAAAWDLRRRARPAEIRFDRLLATRPVSVTGRACGRDCAHCGGHYLEGMFTPETAAAESEAAAKAGAVAEAAAGTSGQPAARAAADRRPRVRSWLVSGGCDSGGRVPLLANEGLLETLARSGPLNLHVGLIRTEEEARAVARYASAVSLDFTVDQEAIDEVYGFDGVTPADFVRAYELLRAHTRVTPHVLIGLRGGRVHRELDALRELARLAVEAVALLVLIPTVGSRYADLDPPPLDEAVRVTAEARLLLPEASVHLGCMRPKGAYRQALDVLAVRAGVDRIAVPTPAAVREAERLGLRVVWSDECCVFQTGTDA